MSGPHTVDEPPLCTHEKLKVFLCSLGGMEDDDNIMMKLATYTLSTFFGIIKSESAERT